MFGPEKYEREIFCLFTNLCNNYVIMYSMFTDYALYTSHYFKGWEYSYEKIKYKFLFKI